MRKSKALPSRTICVRKGICIAGAVAALLAAAALFIPVLPAVSVGLDRDAPLTVFPLGRNESFSIRFVHSIDGLPIIESYRLDGLDLVQMETRLLSFGVGTGYIDGEGTLTEDGDWVVIENMERPIGRLRQRVGVAAVDHRIIWRDKALPLSQNFPGELFIIEGTRMSLFDRLRLWRAAASATGGAGKGRLWETL